jgi:hypothetical protein
MNNSTREWGDWQRRHSAALEALQDAERAYQRTITGSAFAGTEGPSPIELQKEALERLEQARRDLDRIRREQPKDVR